MSQCPFATVVNRARKWRSTTSECVLSESNAINLNTTILIKDRRSVELIAVDAWSDDSKIAGPPIESAKRTVARYSRVKGSDYAGEEMAAGHVTSGTSRRATRSTIKCGSASLLEINRAWPSVVNAMPRARARTRPNNNNAANRQ